MKDTLEKTIPVFSSQKRELKNELDWLVFTKEKSQLVKQSKKTK